MVVGEEGFDAAGLPDPDPSAGTPEPASKKQM